MLDKLFKKKPENLAAEAIYEAAVAQARLPVFYEAGGVADSVQGRFEMIAVHVALIVRRLATAGSDAARLQQAVFDVMFRDLDSAMRELGVGDLIVGKKVRRFAEAFYGRARAYSAALDAGDREQLTAALSRNVFGGDEAAADRLAAYVEECAQALESRPTARILIGVVRFPYPDAYGDAEAA